MRNFNPKSLLFVGVLFVGVAFTVGLYAQSPLSPIQKTIPINKPMDLTTAIGNLAGPMYKGDAVTLQFNYTYLWDKPVTYTFRNVNAASLTITSGFTPTVANPTFSNISFDFENINVPITFQNVVFTNINGTAILCNMSSQFTVDGCTFSNAATPGNIGKAIDYERQDSYTDPTSILGPVLINNCTFDSITIPADISQFAEGVVQINLWKDIQAISIYGCTFSNCSSMEKESANLGGDLSIYVGPAWYSNIKNDPAIHIPVIHIGNKGKENTFNRGTGTSQLGMSAINLNLAANGTFLDLANVKICDNTIENYKAEKGSIYLETTGEIVNSPTISGCTFKNNQINTGGQASLLGELCQLAETTTPPITEAVLEEHNTIKEDNAKPYVWTSAGLAML